MSGELALDVFPIASGKAVNIDSIILARVIANLQ
jgi:hypothetical protein